MRHLARQLLQLLLATSIKGDGRSERRQRVLSLLQTHDADTTPSPRSRVRFSFTPSYSGSAGGREATQQLPPIFNTWVRILSLKKEDPAQVFKSSFSGDLGVVKSEYR